MKKFFSVLKEWFDFSSSDRLGISVLLVILVVTVALPQFFDENEFSEEDIARLKAEMDVFIAETEKSEVKIKDSLFVFDPNTVDSISLVLLGFSPAQTKSIINYRKKGGKFRNKENFGHSYVVSDKMFERLYEYIDIKSSNTEKSEFFSYPKKNEHFNKRSDTPVSAKTEDNQPISKKNDIIELNAADTSSLQKLRGIGSYYAKRIADYRNRLGGFYSAEQLLEIKGIDSARFALFRDRIVIDVLQIKRIDINKVDEKELSKHPYINSYTAKSIVKYRKFKGKIGSCDELLNEKIITTQQSEKICKYIEF